MASTPTLRPQPRSGPPGSNGHRSTSAVSLAPPGRRVRVPELVVGVLVIAVFALGAVLWHLSAVDKSPALAVVGTIERGDVIAADDLRVVYVASDDAVARLDEAQMSQVVGRVAAVDLAPGTLISRSLVAERPTVAANEGVVGMALEPGAYPAMGLSPGDRVTVVRTVDPAVAAEDAGDGPDVVIARDATVFTVEDLPSDRRMVSILAAEGDAEAVAAAAGSGSLRLVLVAP